MLTHCHRCPSCRVLIEATDPFSLAWGVESHVCAITDPVGMAVVDWLVGQYGREFWLVRAGLPRVLVT